MSRLALIRIVSCVLAVAVLASGTLSVVEVFFTRRLTQTRTFTAAVQKIQVDDADGDIEIHAGPPGTPTSVRAHTSGAFHTGGHTETLQDGALTLTGTCGHGGSLLLFRTCSVDFDVVVPLGTTVQATSSSGDITVAGVAGPVTAVTDNGDVRLSQIGGAVRIRSDNGDLDADHLTGGVVSARTDNGDVSLKFAAAPSSVTATTSNGDVELALPDVVNGYRVQADTDNGDRDVSVPVGTSSERLIQATSSNGDVHVYRAR